METSVLKKFAQSARRELMEQVALKLNSVLAESSAARRETPKAVEELEKALGQRGRDQVVERVAYIWFNRFCALRFMDVNHYSRVGVVSPASGQSQPEILAEAKMGHIDEDMLTNAAVRERVFGLLQGKVTSNDAQAEAYPAFCWWLHAITGTRPCLSCLSASTIMRNCSCRMICFPKAPFWPKPVRP